MVVLALAVLGCDQPPAQQTTAQQPAPAAQSTSTQPPAPAQTATPQPAPTPANDPPSAQEVTDPSSNDAVKAPSITDAELPPLPVTPFPAARPIDVVQAVYVYAAKHPEVLNQVPCFCGCQNMGHRHNDDCFVKTRNSRGVPTEWEPHGVG
jgi:hypothetical protein